MTNPPRRSRRKRVLALLAGLLAALFLGEIVCRIDALFPGKDYEAGAMRGWLQSRVDALDYGDVVAFVVPDPGVDANQHRPIPDPWSGWTSPWHVRHVSQGTRLFRDDAHPERFDVLLLGGSFAADLGLAGQGELQRQIAALPEVGGRPVELWNMAFAAQKQPAHLNRLVALLGLGWKPDLVVCVDGYNELAIATENAAVGIHPTYPFVAFWNGMARAGDVDTKALDVLVEMRAAQRTTASRAQLGLDYGVWRSALVSRAWSVWIGRSQAGFRAARDRAMGYLGTERSQVAIRGPVTGTEVSGANAPGSDASGVTASVAAWADAALNLRAICDRRGLPLVHALQPGLDDAGSKPATEEEVRTCQFTPHWRDAVRNGFPQLRARVAELAGAGVVVRDGSRVFAENTETLYVDGCHLNDRGYELYGAWLTARIRDALQQER